MSKEIISFGSCNRQNLPQNFWDKISKLQASHFLWIGDAVYTKNYDFSSLPVAFQQLLSNKNYTTFSQTTYVDGIWDDHDYGVNDGGITVKDRLERQKQYRHFLKQSNPALDLNDSQDGLYHSLDIKLRDKTAKVLFLDTRSHRSDHFLPSIGQYKFPFSPILAAGLRGLYSIFGLGRSYSGQVLSENQWTWLTETLQQSTADVHVLVSSIQILTTNPVVESWGHFPIEKRRLLQLLQQIQPSNLLFLSGDVHMAELSAAKLTTTTTEAVNYPTHWIEITSSGMTHSCRGNMITKVLCPLMTKLFAKHRQDIPSASHTENGIKSEAKSISFDKNFGSLEITDTNELLIRIYSLEEDQLEKKDIFDYADYHLPPIVLEYRQPLMRYCLLHSN
jgi:alkaline phosphatase D